MIKAVVFDIDGVLIDSLGANFKFFQDLMRKAGYQPPTRKEFLPIFHFSMWDVIKVLIGSPNEEEIKRIWELGKSGSIKYPYNLLITPKYVEKTINILSKNYLLGIVTNRIREGIYKIPSLRKLKKHFKATVAYQDTVNHKPHPEPLLLASKKLGINPSQAVYIGDAKSDIIAGKSSGMKTVLYSKTPLYEADLYTSSFAKLPELIKSLNNNF